MRFIELRTGEDKFTWINVAHIMCIAEMEGSVHRTYITLSSGATLTTMATIEEIQELVESK
jgi:hypothetical protein